VAHLDGGPARRGSPKAVTRRGARPRGGPPGRRPGLL